MLSLEDLFIPFRYMQKTRIVEYVDKAYIVWNGEDITGLTNCLSGENIQVEVIRRDYTQEELSMPGAIRCLLNHSNCWRKIADSAKPGLVIEADFVPCRRFGSLEVPFDPSLDVPTLAYLYAIGPVIYHYDGNGGFFGHSAGTVAYIITPAAASAWLELLENHKKLCDFNHYYQWEVEMPRQLWHQKGVRSYISSKSYGEHGGIPNPEHKNNGFTSWHQADSLIGPLSFMPAYAKGKSCRYIFFRARSRVRYMYKFFAGKYFDTWLRFFTLKPARYKKFMFAFHRAFF